MIELLNNLFAPLYETFFDFATNNVFLNCVYNNSDYAKIGGVLIITSVLLLFIFYKIWDPIKKSRLKWFLTILIIALISSILTRTILIEMNDCLRIEIGNFNGDGPDPLNFALAMSLISFLYALIVASILSIIPFRLLSSNNSHNPF